MDDLKAVLRGWLSSMAGSPVDTAKLAASGSPGPAWAMPNDPQLGGELETIEADNAAALASAPGGADWFSQKLSENGLSGGSPWAEMAGGFLPSPSLASKPQKIIAGSRARNAPKEQLDNIDQAFTDWMGGQRYQDIRKGPDLEWFNNQWQENRAGISPEGHTIFEIPTRYGFVKDRPEGDEWMRFGLPERRLGEIITGDPMLEAYPELADIRVRQEPGMGWGGNFDPAEKIINLGDLQTTNDLESVLAHEIQHAVQQLEGWQGGANPASLIPYVGTPEINELTQKLMKDPNSRMLRDKYETLVKAEADKLYRSAYGETQARNVQARMGLSEYTPVPLFMNDDLPWSLQTDPYRGGK